MASPGNLFGLPSADLDHILRHAAADLHELHGSRLFITGGTGFFGKWLLAALVHAGTEMRLDLKLEILSRQPAAFLESHPEVAAQKNILFRQGDVSSLSSAGPFSYDYILHGATDAVGIATLAQEKVRAETMELGTVRLLDLARRSGARRTMLVSSGAVYGNAAGNPSGAAEDDAAQARPFNPYGHGKQAMEKLGADSGLDIVIARPFAFLGPLLPLDAHYAAGNFLRDAVRGGPILVRGDGTTVRSYLHPADLVPWLLRVLVRGQQARAYNIGSDEPVSMAGLAQAIAEACPTRPQVIVEGNPVPGANVYLPNIRRAREELGLDVFIPLREAIARTLAFLTPSS